MVLASGSVNSMSEIDDTDAILRLAQEKIKRWEREMAYGDYSSEKKSGPRPPARPPIVPPAPIELVASPYRMLGLFRLSAPSVTLEPFVDRVTCVKCGARDDTRYDFSGLTFFHCRGSWWRRCSGLPEHIHWKCARCKAKWLSRTFDISTLGPYR